MHLALSRLWALPRFLGPLPVEVSPDHVPLGPSSCHHPGHTGMGTFSPNPAMCVAVRGSEPTAAADTVGSRLFLELHQRVPYLFLFLSHWENV